MENICYNTYRCHTRALEQNNSRGSWNRIWSSIEVVITSTTGNRVAANTARGFESLLLRHVGASVKSFAPTFLQKSERTHFAAPPLQLRPAFLLLTEISVLTALCRKIPNTFVFGILCRSPQFDFVHLDEISPCVPAAAHRELEHTGNRGYFSKKSRRFRKKQHSMNRQARRDGIRSLSVP